MGGRAPGPGLLAPRLAAHVGLARVPVGEPLPGGDQGRSRPSSGAVASSQLARARRSPCSPFCLLRGSAVSPGRPLGGEKVRGWVGTPGPRPRAAPLTALSLSLLRLESGPPAPRPRAPGGKRARRRGSWERSCRAEPCSRPHFPCRHLVPGEEDGDGQVAFQQPVAPGLAAPLQLHPAPPAGHRRAQW